MVQKITNALLVATFVVVLFTASQTRKVTEYMENAAQHVLSGQQFTSAGVTTERFIGEAKEDFLARHREVVKATDGER